jgi:23S rRNA (cytidine1920-2'-O)/16S rRNA (cytidine1409-2'-O)-methyltransferase
MKEVSILMRKANVVNPARKRADILLVERGLATSREQGQALIMAGKVYTNIGKVLKPGMTIASDTPLDIRGTLPFVSRGGTKLSHALDQFHLDVEGWLALDVGASTGGFTDCLLQRGARHVYSLDVGRGQLVYRLRHDPRVTVMEKINAHHPFSLPERMNLATVDVSFISVTMVIPNVVAHLGEDTPLVVLVKPQFEVKRQEVPRGGVIRDPKLHATVLGRVIVWAVGSGLRLVDMVASPILGGAGNREFFLLLYTTGRTRLRTEVLSEATEWASD